jgi:DNA-binding protein HU-beta
MWLTLEITPKREPRCVKMRFPLAFPPVGAQNARFSLVFPQVDAKNPHKIRLRRFSTRFSLLYHGRLSCDLALNYQGGSMAAGMTKTQLVRHMAEKVGTNNKTAASFLETLAETAVKETKKNGMFVLPGLGRLKKVQRKARMGRNPQTGEPIKIAAKTTAKFYLAKVVKDSIAPKKA